MNFVFFVQHKKGSMKHMVNLPCFGEVELVYDGGEDFDNSEESFLLQSKLQVSNGTFEISGF